MSTSWPWLAALALLSGCTAEPPAPTAPIHFVDVGRDAGLDFTHFNGFSGEYYYVETFGAGAAFLDYDGDWDLDLYLVNGTYLKGLPPDPLPRNHLYQNQGQGTFHNASGPTTAADPGYGFGVSAADYDGDGDQDLFVANYGPNALYRNDSGTFARSGVGVEDPRWGTSAGFFDYDLDGDLDLFVANYVHFSLDANIVCKVGKTRSYCEPAAYSPIGDILYRNDGDRFTDVSDPAGITLEGRGLGVAFADYDLDGDTDLYVANDGTMNFLYENQRGTFAEVGQVAGTRYDEHGHAEAGMGTDFGDYDRDGDMDLFVTNFAFETNTLYQNDGQGQFTIASGRLGLGEASLRPLGFGTRFFRLRQRLRPRPLCRQWTRHGRGRRMGLDPDLPPDQSAIPQRGRPTLRRRLCQYGTSLHPSQCRARHGRGRLRRRRRSRPASYHRGRPTAPVAQRQWPPPPLSANLPHRPDPSRRPRCPRSRHRWRRPADTGAPIGG